MDSVLRPISLPNILCLPQQALDCGGDVAKMLESKALRREPWLCLQSVQHRADLRHCLRARQGDYFVERLKKVESQT